MAASIAEVLALDALVVQSGQLVLGLAFPGSTTTLLVSNLDGLTAPTQRTLLCH